MRLKSTTLEGAIQNALNTLISSDAIQNMEFTVSSDCTKVSTLNTIQFCDELAVSDSYSSSFIDDTCTSACEVTYDIAIEAIDDERKLCKTACSCCDWACGGCCSDGCQDVSDDEKSAANAALDACKEMCSWTTITGGYDLRVNNVEGCGNIDVTNVYNLTARPDDLTKFDLSFDVAIGEIKGHASAKIWQDPIPAITISETIVAPAYTLGKGTAVLTMVCDSDNPGYYLQLTSCDITIPTNIYDSAGLIALAESIGMDVSALTGGIVDLTEMWMELANGLLTNYMLGMLNDLLADYKIMDCSC